MKISEQDLQRYLIDLSNSYPDSEGTKIENAYAQAVRETTSHILALMNGSITVAYTRTGGTKHGNRLHKL